MINFSNYKCSFCGKEGVKLWHIGDGMLICACCAEKRQAPRTQEEFIWRKDANSKNYSGKATGRLLRLPNWKVDKDGCIPSSWSTPASKKLYTPVLPIKYNGETINATPAYASNVTNAKEKWMAMPN